MSSTLSSTAAYVQKDSSVDSGHVAAIIVCMLIGLVVLCYGIYRLAKRYCPNMLLAMSPQDNSPRLARSSSAQQIDYNTQHTAATDKAQQQEVDKKGDSHAIEMPSPLSINEQWTIRDAPAEDEDTA